ncbi:MULTISPECIES: DUF5125 domain-containing protein [unclassified Sphingobacterium]|uniref:DUF5125 domain-containing protein n=1 Tax=unclassified Sphingobacterium TaxID=2609468 RepID=UPI001046E3AB|nr:MULTISPECIES: DUF5125 domain-containing protein [unclassified Sphingobacterium]MCS3553423.1 hypothetical protein [Sphingobacterium sp. JUb21]TCR09367.1 uncharacterized protein DUF5016 [Sphingobacterium sp. JUb20]
MKRPILNFLFGTVAVAALYSCKKDEKYVYQIGEPKLEVKSDISAAHFGDSLVFQVHASDQEIALSTVKVQLFFTDDQVSETTIRTKENGDYSGKIFIPFYKNVPNGKATLKFILQNISQKMTEQSYEIDLTRPDFPYLNLVTESKSYKMEKIGTNEYAVTESFPSSVKGYIQAPKVGEQGNPMNFGCVNNTVEIGSMTEIPFTNLTSGVYSIKFNTLTYEASPFINIYLNGNLLSRMDDDHFKGELELKNGEQVTFDGIDDVKNWWIDPDYFTQKSDGSINFNGINGKYRITVDFKLKYFLVESMDGANLASLKADGTGAIWIIGEGIGKPGIATNQVGWSPEKALCMMPIGNKKYQITLKAGESIHASNINFKFFHQKDWGGEFGATSISTDNDMIFIGDGNNGRDSGNLGIVSGKSLALGTSYILTVDLSQGNSKAILTVVKK